MHLETRNQFDGYENIAKMPLFDKRWCDNTDNKI